LKDILKEFPSISVEDWEKLIQKDLKGQDYDKKLIWKTDDGFSLNPYYTEETTKGKNLPKPPGMPLTWQIIEEINESNPSKALNQAESSSKVGVQGWKLLSQWNKDTYEGICLDSAAAIQNFAESLYSIQSDANYYWETGSSSLSYQEAIVSLLKKNSKQQLSKQETVGGFFQDPLGALTVCGELPQSKKDTFETLKKSILLCEESLPGHRAFSVSGNLFAEAGANLSQEIAYSLAIGSEYISQMQTLGVPAEVTARQIIFRFSVGSNYFHEIAKLRAFRFLWAKVLEAYKIPEEQRAAYIYTETSQWNATVFDPNVNMIRVTTEAMSAILGGTNALHIHPYDKVSAGSGNEFSNRIARNVSLLLRHESYLDKVVDPSNGSYYIDHLTYTFSESAWSLFREIEADKGYLQSFLDSKIQKAIESTVKKKKEAILSKKEPILGTSLFPNLSETTTSLPTKEWTKAKNVPSFSQNIGEPDSRAKIIPTWRASEAFELLRFRVEQSSAKLGKPKIHLLIYGNASMRTARASFATNFFGVAGFEIVNPGATEDAEKSFATAMSSQPSVLVLCSSDEEYLPLVQKLQTSKEWKSTNTKFVIAGSPTESIDTLKSAGIHDFIHAKSNLYETLETYINLLLK